MKSVFMFFSYEIYVVDREAYPDLLRRRSTEDHAGLCARVRADGRPEASQHCLPHRGLHAGGTKCGSACRRNQRWVCKQEEPKVGLLAGGTKGGSAGRRNQRWVCRKEEPKVGQHVGGTKGGSAGRRNQRWVYMYEEPKVGQHAGRTKGGGHQVAIRNVTASNPDIQPNYSYKV